MWHITNWKVFGIYDVWILGHLSHDTNTVYLNIIMLCVVHFVTRIDECY